VNSTPGTLLPQLLVLNLEAFFLRGEAACRMNRKSPRLVRINEETSTDVDDEGNEGDAFDKGWSLHCLSDLVL